MLLLLALPALLLLALLALLLPALSLLALALLALPLAVLERAPERLYWSAAARASRLSPVARRSGL
jgi:hypothetical protein